MLAAIRRASSRVSRLFRNVPTFGRMRVTGGVGRVPWRVAVTPNGPSYRIGARRTSIAATTATAAPIGVSQDFLGRPAAALRELEAALRCSSSLIVENIKRRQADV
jgi:hypothetical protein